jgi:signal transduction histidine kinase
MAMEIAPTHEAKRLVGRQLGFAGHAIVYWFTCLLLLVVAGPFVAVVVGLSWGIGLAAHGFFAVAAPLLRAPLERGTARVLAAKAPPLEATRDARALEDLAAAIAHEIRNPITAAKSLVQQIAEAPAAPETSEYATVAVAELDRVERSIVHLLRYAREESLTLAPVHMVDVVQSAVEATRDRAAGGGVRITTALEDGGVVRGDAELLRRVLVNLIVNAVEALAEAESESPAVEIASGPNLAGTEIWVTVRDNGPGVDPTVAPRVFAPFFTTKQGGTGFGLALAKKTIEAHGGTIEVGNRPGGGAEISFTIPRAERALGAPGAT